MTETEFKAWARFTMVNAGHWTVDEVQLHNHGTYLFYCGYPSDPSKGIFVTIDGGELETGTYEYAIPHIGEAMFKVKRSAQFVDQDAALKHAVEGLGLSFLLAITHGTSPLFTLHQ